MTTWDELLGPGKTQEKKHSMLLGGDLELNKNPNHYAGNIVRIRDYNERMTFHFTWAAAETQRGWTKREMRKVTLRKDPLSGSIEEGVLRFGGHTLYLKGKGPLKEDQVVERYTHSDRKRKPEEPLPLFKDRT